MNLKKKSIPKYLKLEYHALGYREYQYNKNKKIKWKLSLLITLSLFLLLLNWAHAENIEYQSGQLLFKNQQGHQFDSLHVSSHADVEIHGMIASISLSQQFKNTSDDWVEGRYLFPLDSDSAVTQMEIQIGERVIKGEIKEKKQAQKIYQRAKKAGKKAVLTEQHRGNLFSQKIANIGPHQSIKVIINFIQTVEYNQNHFEWRLPTTLTPRFIPQKAMSKQALLLSTLSPSNSEAIAFNKPIGGWRYSNSIIEDAALITPPIATNKQVNNLFSINILLDAGLALANISAPYHELKVEKHQGKHEITLANKSTQMDRDFVLSWQPVTSEIPQSALFTDVVSQQPYALLMTMPPITTLAKELFARDIMFIIDTSGSMGGSAIREAKQSLLQALSRLNNNDRFNIIEFNSDFSSVFSSIQIADNRHLQTAQYWVQQLKADGGTEMYPALDWSFNQLSQLTTSDNLQQVIFITDGAIGNEKQLFNLIHRKLGDSRLFTVGIGSAPNSYFMRKAAQFGRGTFTHIGNDKEVFAKMNQLFIKLESAVAKNITIDWPLNSEFYPKKIPDLYAGEPLLIAAKLDGLSGEIQITGNTQNKFWINSLNLNQVDAENSKGIASIWARRKISMLEDEKIRGADPELTRSAITQIALNHHLLSSYTSFIAVDNMVSRPFGQLLKTKAVPNLLAQGQQLQQIAYPQTATNSGLYLWLSILSFSGFLLYTTIDRKWLR